VSVSAITKAIMRIEIILTPSNIMESKLSACAFIL
jgi:hypothetical protein